MVLHFYIFFIGVWMVQFEQDFSFIYKPEQLGTILISLSISAMVTRIFSYQSIEGNLLKKHRMIQISFLMNISKKMILFNESKNKTANDWRECCHDCASEIDKFYFKATPNSIKEIEPITEYIHSHFIATNYSHAVRSTDGVVKRLKSELNALNSRSIEILDKQLKVLRAANRN